MFFNLTTQFFAASHTPRHIYGHVVSSVYSQGEWGRTSIPLISKNGENHGTIFSRNFSCACVFKYWKNSYQDFCFTSFFDPFYIDSIDSTFSPESTRRTRRSLIFWNIFRNLLVHSFVLEQCMCNHWVYTWRLIQKTTAFCTKNSEPSTLELYLDCTVSGQYFLMWAFVHTPHRDSTVITRHVLILYRYSGFQ